MSAIRCYHPTITGQEAETLLLEKGFDGSYLTRPSQNTPGNYSLSVKRGDQIVHVRIQNQGEYYDLYGGEKFANLCELIDYYIENPGLLKEKDGTLIELLQPLYCEDLVTTERWYHTGLDGKTAEQLLLSRGHIGSYLVRMSTRSPGNYVLSVRIEDEVTHITIIFNDGWFSLLQGGPSFSSLDGIIGYCLQNPFLDSFNRAVVLTRPFVSTSFLPSHISQRITELEKPSGFAYGKSGFFEEFEELQKKEIALMSSRHEGTKPENRTKNRFKNILPFDHSIVVLKDPPTPGETYINANYLSGEVPNSKKCYIATQGCLPETVNDFWHMIWQERSLLVVMITKEMEKGRPKCCHYWPSLNETCMYGRISVHLIEEIINPQFITRHLIVTNQDEERNIYQYQFKGWPEHGVPEDPAIFLSFVEQVNLRDKDLQDAGMHPGPKVIQCSAGIGRTGTYIITDVLIKLLEYQGWDEEIDIQCSIQRLRGFRSGIVQTDLQYKLVYRVIQYYIEASQRCMEARSNISTESTYSNVDMLLTRGSPRRVRGASQSPKIPPKPPQNRQRDTAQ